MRFKSGDAALKLKKMKVILLDVDGVLTDGGIVLGPDKIEMKLFNVRDGHRIKMARRGGLKIFFITGRKSEAVEKRAAELGIDGIFQGVLEKKRILGEIVDISGFSLDEMSYMGDDLVDLPVMREVGLSCCPSDAVPEVLERSEIVVDIPGGKGAAGKFIEEILKAQGKWDELTRNYLV